MTLKDQELQVIWADVQMMPLDAMKLWYQDFVKFSAEILKENLDYWTIPGTWKPTLYKAGAEKLRFVYWFTVEMEKTDQELDVQNDFYTCDYKATVRSKSWQLLSQCEGNCSTQESKYFYNFSLAGPQPSYDEATILKEKWLGKRKKIWDKWVFLEKIESKNKIGLRNTIQKMAQKRAFVWAILIATGASEFYTQDLEDMDIPIVDWEIEPEQPKGDESKSGAPENTTSKKKTNKKSETKPDSPQKPRFNDEQYDAFLKVKDKYKDAEQAIKEISIKYSISWKRKAQVEELYQ